MRQGGNLKDLVYMFNNMKTLRAVFISVKILRQCWVKTHRKLLQGHAATY
jgi:hypothetical protein